MAISETLSAGTLPRNGRDVFFALGIVFILAVLFLPIPAFLIDVGLAFSIALSVLILMVALWIGRPLDFSSFPTVLLIATMLRLSLNIATTRMILSHGNEGTYAAGYVISGFSKLVMSSDFVIGLIVFLILIVVNFIVITKGATRIAEVGARFTLDAIPGKQMSIDADLSAGMIDDKTAQLRRRELEEESSFFGSMDGASKFVRGDAIAGLIITAINIVGGIAIGYLRHGMGIGEAADVFIKLSVGDGLVTQIPALIVSLAAGLLVSKGGTRGSADQAVFGQLGAYPRALYVAASLLLLLGLMPGLPLFPFLVMAAAMASLGYVIPLRESRRVAADQAAKKQESVEKAEEEKNSVKASLATAEIELLIGKQLVYVGITLMNFAILTALVVLVLGVSLRGNPMVLLLATFVYAVAATGFGLMVSMMSSTQVTAVFASTVLSVMPTLQFSGMLTPVSSLDGPARLLGSFWPTTWYMAISVGSYTKALGLADLSGAMMRLAIFGPLFTGIAIALLRKQER